MKKKPFDDSSRMTIHEAAGLIGVSSMTVSRVLNGDPKVKKETRERVRAAIERIGYTPNLAARRLASAKSIRIGMLYNNPSASYLSDLLIGILDASSRMGCQIVLEKCSPRSVRAAIEKFVADELDGVMLPPPLADSPVVLRLLQAANIPCIGIAGRPVGQFGLSVNIDNFEAARAMTRHLLELGHRDIAFIRGASNQRASEQRYEGFAAALREAGIELKAHYVKQGDFTYRSGLTAAEEILVQPSRPTALFACNDDMAAAAIATAHRLHLEVPGDLTVVGFDDTLLATTIWPPLTTIHQPIAAMATAAIALLIDEVRLRAIGKSSGPLQRIMPYSLVKRESSTRCPESER